MTTDGRKQELIIIRAHHHAVLLDEDVVSENRRVGGIRHGKDQSGVGRHAQIECSGTEHERLHRRRHCLCASERNWLAHPSNRRHGYGVIQALLIARGHLKWSDDLSLVGHSERAHREQHADRGTGNAHRHVRPGSHDQRPASRKRTDTGTASAKGTTIHKTKNSHRGLGRCNHTCIGRRADQKNSTIQTRITSQRAAPVSLLSGRTAIRGNNAQNAHQRQNWRNGARRCSDGGALCDAAFASRSSIRSFTPRW